MSKQTLETKSPQDSLRSRPEPDWERFVREYDPVLGREVGRSLARLGFTEARDLVDDLKQDAYCRLLEGGRSLPSLSEGGLVTRFLQRVAWSVAVDWLRREMAAKRGGDLRFVPPVGETGECLLDWRPSRDLDPEQRLLRREEVRRVRRRIRRSVGPRRPERDRAVVEMVVLEHRSAREIARDLDGDLSLSGIYSIMKRVRERMAGRELVDPCDRVPFPAAP